MRPVIIRADGANGIGLGHIRRCVEIGRVLKERGAHVPFISASNSVVDPILAEFKRPMRRITSEGDAFEYIASSFPGSVIVLDTPHPYSVPEIERLKHAGCAVFMMQNDCPGMLASNYAVFPDGHHEPPNGGWGDTVPLVGLDYVIVPQVVKRLVSAMSASPFLTAYRQEGHITVVAGASDPWRILPQMASLFCKLPSYKVVFLEGQDTDYHDEMVSLCDPGRMASLQFNYYHLFSARTVITVFGCTAYELIYAGRPFLALGPNARYARYAKTLSQRTHALNVLGWPCTTDDLRTALLSLMAFYWDMAAAQRGLIDGAGAERIADHILQEARCGD